MLEVVLNDWVIDTNETPYSSNSTQPQNAVSGHNASDAASAEQNLANALAKLPTLTPGPPGTKAKMRLENSLAVQLPASAMYF